MVAAHEVIMSNIPHLEQYMGLWAMPDDKFLGLLHNVNLMDIVSHVQAQAGRSRKPSTDYEMADGVAIIEIQGAMTKYGSSLFGNLGTVELRRQVQNAMRADGVKSIVLKIDSPGGTVSGTKDLADAVAEAAGLKPVIAYIEDMGASAAYWVASQATSIFANEMALTASIGTYGVVYDYSGMAAREGVKALVFKSGEFKGMGTPGTEVTEAQQAEFQRIVDEMNSYFVKAVSQGRKLSLSQVREVADGRAQMAKDAMKMGLIDGIKSFEQVIKSARSSASPTRQPTADLTHQEEYSDMAHNQTLDSTPEEPKGPQPATYSEIVAECDGATAEFIVSQLDAQATVEQARRAWMRELREQQAQAAKRAAEAEAKASRPGVVPVGYGKGEGGDEIEASDPIEAWDKLVATQLKLGLGKQAAIKAARKADPELHEAYIEAYNANHRPRPSKGGEHYGRAK